MTAFDFVEDEPPRGSRRRTDDNLGVDRFGSLGRRLARRGGCEEFLSCDEPLDDPPKDKRRQPLRDLGKRLKDRLGGDSTERPLLGKLQEVLKEVGKIAPKELKPFIDFITDIVDIKHTGSLLRGGKKHFDIERKAASEIPLDISQGPFKLTAVGLAKDLSFDFSLKDGLTDIKGLSVKTNLGVSIPIEKATVVMKDGKPHLSVTVTFGGLSQPILIPLSQVMDKK